MFTVTSCQNSKFECGKFDSLRLPGLGAYDAYGAVGKPALDPKRRFNRAPTFSRQYSSCYQAARSSGLLQLQFSLRFLCLTISIAERLPYFKPGSLMHVAFNCNVESLSLLQHMLQH